MKSKMGRPKVPKRKARAPGISVRFTPEERKAIDTAITASGLTQSNWARKVLLAASGCGNLTP